MKHEFTPIFSSRWRSLLISILFGINIALLIGVSIASFSSRQKLVLVRKEWNSLLTIERSLSELKHNTLLMELARRGAGANGGSDPLAEVQARFADVAEISTKLGVAFERFPVLQSEWKGLEREIVDHLGTTIDLSTRSAAFSESNERRFAVIERELLERLQRAEGQFLSTVNRVTLILNLAAFLAVGTGVVGVAMLLSAIREQDRMRSLEREKSEAERSDREKSKFLASMNHEIRTPLNAMLGFSELLKREIESERGNRYLKAINESGESLSALINDILDLSKIESGMLELEEEPIRIQDFARSIEVLFLGKSQSSGIGLITEVETPDVEVVSVDSLRLRQVLVNLLGNAFKFTESGAVTLRFLTSAPQDESCDLVIEVEDTGRGISAEKLEMIFRPFQQAESSDEMKGGTGLGLSISRELAHLMNGSLEAESEEGKGSLFRLRLSDVKVGGKAPESAYEQASSWDFTRFEPVSILVVDDNHYNRELIAGFFEEAGHELAFAEDGAAALESLADVPADLVLMDIRMPRMGGEEALRRMRAHPDWKEIPVIAITASSLMREERKLRELFDGYLRKPFTGAELFGEIRKILPLSTNPEPDFGQGAQRDENNNPGTETTVAVREKLAALYEAKGAGLKEAMVFSEIRQWSRELDEFAKVHQLDWLADYADRLRNLTDAFDQVEIERELTRFPELIDP